MTSNTSGASNTGREYVNGSATVEDHVKRTKASTSTSTASKKEDNIPPSKGYKKKLNLSNYFKAGLMDIKDQSGVQSFLSQFKIDSYGNE